MLSSRWRAHSGHFGSTARLTDDLFRDRWPVWSPDGKELAFYSNRSGSYGIWAIKPDGSGLRPITEEPPGGQGQLLFPVYSPKGDRMVASRARSAESLIFDPRRAWPAQSPESLAVKMPDGAWIVPSAWSPDGRLLAGTITTASGSSMGMGVYDLAARTARTVFTGPSGYGCTWLGDSRRLIYLFADALWLLDVESGRRRELQSNIAANYATLAPDGRTIYVGLSRSQADLWMGELKGKRP